MKRVRQGLFFAVSGCTQDGVAATFTALLHLLILILLRGLAVVCLQIETACIFPVLLQYL